MAYDSVRAQLDKLLGADRNGPVTNAIAAPVSYTDASVCKNYLLGFCPNDLYIKHRSEPGSCPRQHLLAARDAFEKDRAAGKAAADEARWTRDLFVECRTILDDEERRIRAHARRLQESYNATGSLTGLMIRNFDTLKKLGMVSQNAKIRILKEMDELNDTLDTPLAPEESSKEQEKADSEDVPSERDSPAGASLTKDNVCPRSDHEDGPGDHVDADDDKHDEGDEDFGVISVIPASTSTKDTTDAATPVNPAENGSGKAHGQSPSGVVADLESAGTKVLPLNKEHSKEERFEDKDKAKGQNDERGGNPTKKTGNVQQNLQGHAVADPSTTLKPPTETEDKMEEFYRNGVGPDGLVMLTRKQSLRVCACCGGFISLVDAESRLLSHYGGKSHHSLVQLREKVAELEKTVATKRGLVRDLSPRDYHRGRRDEYETNWSRGDERRPRHWDARDRDRRRRERDVGYDGHGSVDWHHGSYRRRRDRSRDRGHRSRYEERFQEDRYSGRYGHGRKRYRSTSPMRSNRRQRYRY